MVSHNQLVEEMFGRVQAVLQVLEQLDDVEVLAVEPDPHSYSQRFYVLIDSPTIVAHVGFWSNRTVTIGAMNLRQNSVLLDYSVTVQQASDIDAHISKLVSLFQFPA